MLGEIMAMACGMANWEPPPSNKYGMEYLMDTRVGAVGILLMGLGLCLSYLYQKPRGPDPATDTLQGGTDANAHPSRHDSGAA